MVGGPGQRTGTLWVLPSTGHLHKGPLGKDLSAPDAYTGYHVPLPVAG